MNCIHLPPYVDLRQKAATVMPPNEVRQPTELDMRMARLAQAHAKARKHGGGNASRA